MLSDLRKKQCFGDCVELTCRIPGEQIFVRCAVYVPRSYLFENPNTIIDLHVKDKKKKAIRRVLLLSQIKKLSQAFFLFFFYIG